jgi:hypothetical protein
MRWCREEEPVWLEMGWEAVSASASASGSLKGAPGKGDRRGCPVRWEVGGAFPRRPAGDQDGGTQARRLPDGREAASRATSHNTNHKHNPPWVDSLLGLADRCWGLAFGNACLVLHLAGGSSSCP